MVSPNAHYVAFAQKQLLFGAFAKMQSLKFLHFAHLNALEVEHFAPKSSLCNIENKLQSQRGKKKKQNAVKLQMISLQRKNKIKLEKKEMHIVHKTSRVARLIGN